jgi:hypothetical protein
MGEASLPSLPTRTAISWGIRIAAVVAILGRAEEQPAICWPSVSSVVPEAPDAAPRSPQCPPRVDAHRYSAA